MEQQLILSGYRDDFPHTAPVGSFPANSLGIHDLAGNMWEFVADWYDADQKDRTHRGGSFDNAESGLLLTSYRSHGRPTGRFESKGFRVVLATQ